MRRKSRAAAAKNSRTRAENINVKGEEKPARKKWEIFFLGGEENNNSSNFQGQDILLSFFLLSQPAPRWIRGRRAEWNFQMFAVFCLLSSIRNFGHKFMQFWPVVERGIDNRAQAAANLNLKSDESHSFLLWPEMKFFLCYCWNVAEMNKKKISSACFTFLATSPFLVIKVFLLRLLASEKRRKSAVERIEWRRRRHVRIT